MKQPKDKIVLAEETTTLPEGAVLTVFCWHMRPRATRVITLAAYHHGERVEMRVDDVSVHNLRQYLDLLVREIMRQRQAMIEPPPLLTYQPSDMSEFVQAMANKGMFIFDALIDEPATTEKLLQGSQKISDPITTGKPCASSEQVRSDGNGVKRGSGTAAPDRRRKKRRVQ